MAAGRNGTTQPSYDFLTGLGTPSPLQQSVRQSRIVKPDHGNEDLRAEIKALQYELSTFSQERELLVLRHEKELREAQSAAEGDFRKTQASESERNAALRKYESLARELREVQEAAATDRASLERELRGNRERLQALEETAEEAQSELSAQERQSSHRINDLQRRNDTLQQTSDELRRELEDKFDALKDAQQSLSQKETMLGDFENEIMRLKAQSGDADTLAVIKRELSEQVAHIQKLESTNREQLAELKHYRKLQKSIEVVEEEKRGLENRLSIMSDLRRELSEAQLQNQILEDERKSWTLYLQNQAPAGAGDVEFDSPEALARAWVQERLEKASLMEKMGSLQPEVSERDELIRSLETEKSALKSELERMRAKGGTHGGARSRLERQRALALKEVDFLRAQLKTFDSEETTFHEGSFNEQKTQRIQELETLVDQYRQEARSLHEQLAVKEEGSTPPAVASSGNKRPHEEEPDERLGILTRKNRALLDDISQLHQKMALLEKELEVHRSQVASLRNTPRTRILELRSNPTSNEAAVRTSTLNSLRTENAALLAQLEGQAHTKVVPISTLENAQQQLGDMKRTVAEKEKRMRRLKEIWSAKSLEFREAVASILGWKMDFMPNGRVRVTSMYYAGDDNDDDNDNSTGGNDRDDDGNKSGPSATRHPNPSASHATTGDESHSIIFDGEQGTMKISGGPQSAFGREIKDLIRFWVEQRKDIPCFLAAMTLEFYEKTTRATRI